MAAESWLLYGCKQPIPLSYRSESHYRKVNRRTLPWLSRDEFRSQLCYLLTVRSWANERVEVSDYLPQHQRTSSRSNAMIEYGCHSKNMICLNSHVLFFSLKPFKPSAFGTKKNSIFSVRPWAINNIFVSSSVKWEK